MPEFKPSASYQWKEDEIFELKGRDLEGLLNIVRTILGTPESQKVLLLSGVNSMLEGILLKGIEDGKVVEVVQPDEPQLDEKPQ